jgi:hypothetical protein
VGGARQRVPCGRYFGLPHPYKISDSSIHPACLLSGVKRPSIRCGDYGSL